MSKTISVLGATGSVGRQALDVVRKRGYKVDLLTAGRNVRLLETLAREFNPRYVALGDEASAISLKQALADTDIKVFSGEEGICEAIALSRSEVTVNSILGEAGLMPTLAVIDSGKRLALSNKESLVIAGDIVIKRARNMGVEIIPVDSEHSAIFQSLKSGRQEERKRIIVTAAGGPFFGKSLEELSRVTLRDTLNHPTWNMGKKITVDSATLMNKGFELIEACHLFNVSEDKISVTVHRESILHSAVEYIDNAIIGEFSLPDMRMCVQYALDYPARTPAVSEQLDLAKIGRLTFFEPDTEAFPFLSLARESMRQGGAMSAVMNAADEVAVDAFLNSRLDFLGIYRVVQGTFEKMTSAKNITTLEGIIEADREARAYAKSLI